MNGFGYLYRYESGDFYSLSTEQVRDEWRNRGGKNFILVEPPYLPDKTLRVVWYPEKVESLKVARTKVLQ